MDIITLADYKTFANITSPNQDSQLSPLVTFVNQFVSDYIGITSSYFEYLDGDSIILLPSNQKVLSITGNVTIDNEYLENYSITDFIQVNYKLMFKRPVVGKVLITLDDYSNNTAIKEACYLLVKHYNKEEYKPNVQSGQEQIQYSEPKSLPIYIKNILDLYRES